MLQNNGWLGYKKFPAQVEAMDYAATVLAQLAVDYQAETTRTPDLDTTEGE